MNKARTLIAGAVAAGVISVGAVGIAYADTSSTTAPAPSSGATTCATAGQRLTKLQAREAKVQSNLAKLQAAEAAATTAGQKTRADRIQVRISKAQLREQVITNRMDRIEKRCNVAPPAAPTS